MKPYSQDLRERIVRARQAQEESQATIAQRCAVSRSCVERLWPRGRQTGTGAALPHGGGRQRRLRPAARLMRQAVAREPDLTRVSLCEQGARRRGIQVTPKPRCLELQRLRLPRKKVTLGQRTRDAPREALAPGLAAADGPQGPPAPEVSGRNRGHP
jgi:transposase